MAVNVHQRPLPLQNARVRRAQLPSSYFNLGEPGLIAGAVAIVCLLSILFLAQTGSVATAGYELQELESEHQRLLIEAEQFEFRIAQASRLDIVSERAEKLGLRVATSDQLRYATIELPAVPVVASNSSR